MQQPHSLCIACFKNLSPDHKRFYTEQDANKRAFKYLYKKTGGSLDWDFSSNPILDEGWVNSITGAKFYSPTMITPSTTNYINSTFSKKYIYQGSDDSYRKYKKNSKKTSIDRLRDLLLLYK